MVMTPYEWSLRANGSENAPLPVGVPNVQHTQHAGPTDGNPTTVLGDTAFKVTWASGYDPDYYKNIQDKQGVNWDFFKQANIVNAPNTNPSIPGTTAPSIAPGGGGHGTPSAPTGGESNHTHKDSSAGLGL